MLYCGKYDIQSYGNSLDLVFPLGQFCNEIISNHALVCKNSSSIINERKIIYHKINKSAPPKKKKIKSSITE